MALFYCPECGKEVSDTAKFCPNCGYKLPKNKKKKDLVNKKTKTMIIASAITIILIVGVISCLVSILRLNDSEKAQVASLNRLISKTMQENIENKTEEQLHTYQEECKNITKKYSSLKWKQKRKISQYSTVQERISSIDRQINTVREREVQNVIDLVNAIGDVTLDSQSAIDSAKNEYNKLDEEQKNQVTNYSQISDYENQFEALCLSSVINQIKGIGKVSLENGSGSKIDAAEGAYNRLSEDSKKQVSNYSTLKAKRKEYDKLNKYKGLLLDAKAKIKDGSLNAAKKVLKKIPSKFSYKDTKASTLKKQLNSKSAWVALCGVWKTTGGQMRSTEIWDYDGRSKYWYRDFSKGEESVSVKCQLLKSGKVKVKISGSVPIYTSYSSISEGVKSSYVWLDKTKTMSSMGTIRIDQYTTVTISSSGLTVNYFKNSPNESQYFTYQYKTTMNLKKKSKSY
ncbi:MAG: zinc-ribbon domain-containing protein [Lachnospiraceae bacterium]|nr:zinc-ribbon domain-containing protein [Lachnospiraceae bacterium]